MQRNHHVRVLTHQGVEKGSARARQAEDEDWLDNFLVRDGRNAAPVLKQLEPLGQPGHEPLMDAGATNLAQHCLLVERFNEQAERFAKIVIPPIAKSGLALSTGHQLSRVEICAHCGFHFWRHN